MRAPAVQIGVSCFHWRLGTNRVSLVRRGIEGNCRRDVWSGWGIPVRAAGVDVASTASGFQGEELRIVMAAGGTGGHVYPAIAIADEIRRLCGTAKVEFVGTKDRMEWSVVPRAGYEIRAIPAVAIRRPFASFENLLVPAKMLVALFSCWKLLRQLQPHVVVGTGGYVSGPLCLVAALMRCPVVVQEQNAVAGLANRLLGHLAEAVFIAFPAAMSYFPKNKCLLCGNPTRIELRQSICSAAARSFFFPKDVPVLARAESRDDDDAKGSTSEVLEKHKTQVVLVLGGSLGARDLNTAVRDMVVTMLEKTPTRYIIWQTGRRYYEEMAAQVGPHPRLAIFPYETLWEYVNAMHMAYAAADLVVARAGAITCSELLVTGKPSILIPSTNVAEDHQTKNAVEMAEQGTATVLLESSLNSSALAASINELFGDTKRLTDMTRKALKAATPDASNQIAGHVLHLAKRHFYLVVA